VSSFWSESADSRGPDPAPSDAAAAFVRATEFLLERIDYERAPPARGGGEAFRLDRMADLLERLGHPERELPCIHIAGSKGKGSTAAMLDAILHSAGVRTGLFTSPHIQSFSERMRVDGRPIPAGRFAALIDRMRPIVAEMEAGPLGGPTFFELTTALAWLHFLDAEVELVVLEVGLGGRLDATNLCRPIATIITSISRDHTRLLGETLPEIAREKAGIIKPGVPVLSGVTDPSAAAVIAEVAAAQQAPLFRLGLEIRCEASLDEHTRAMPACASVRVTSPWSDHAPVRLKLAGRHQAVNAALATAAADLIDSLGRHAVRGMDVRRGLQSVRWPLRIEVLARSPLLIVDAAHNEASIAALLETLAPLSVQRRILLFAASRDKDVRAMLALVAAACDDLILTRFLGNPRSVALADLVRLLPESPRARVHQAETPAAALALGRSLAAPADLLCASGSLFLAAEVRELVLPAVADSQF
jgi:dihydrofolate synthase/folylpolyglutamate synthase